MVSRALARLCLLLAFTVLAPAQSTIHVPADKPTIQAAIDAANSGDTVLVAPGTYTENLIISKKEITLTSSGGPQATILDDSSRGSVIEIDHTPTTATTISGFTIRNGFGSESNWSGIYT